MRSRRVALSLIIVSGWLIATVGPAWAHGAEADTPSRELLSIAMSLLQVQPDMTEMIADKIKDGLDSADTTGVDLTLVAQAQKAFEAGDSVQTLALLSQATGLSPQEALAMQTDTMTRPSAVPLSDQLATAGAVGRPGTVAVAILSFLAVIAIGFGLMLVRRTR